MQNQAGSKAVVIDGGSFSIKAGFSGDEQPLVQLPSIVSRALYDKESAKGDRAHTYVGHDAVCNQKRFPDINYPIARGKVDNWDDMEEILRHIYLKELHVASEEQPVLLTEKPWPWIEKERREKTTQIMFESFNVPALYIGSQPLLALFASGRTTGLVLDSGDEVSYATPVDDSFLAGHAINAVEFGGKNVTSLLNTSLEANGHGFNLNNLFEQNLVHDIKKRNCYVAQNYETECAIWNNSSETPPNSTYELPNGDIVSIGKERFRSAEALFRPHIAGLEHRGLHELIYSSIKSCKERVRDDLYMNIVVTGGNSMLNGFVLRLQNELSALLSNTKTVCITSPTQRDCSVWTGGSILASLETFQGLWLSREEYEEAGPSIIHRKSF